MRGRHVGLWMCAVLLLVSSGVVLADPLLDGNPSYWRISWTVEDEIAEVKVIIRTAKQRHHDFVSKGERSGQTHTRTYQKGKKFEEDILNDLDQWLSDLLLAKQGDHEAALALLKRENRCPQVNRNSPRLLGISPEAFLRYLSQCGTRVKMLLKLEQQNRQN